MTRVLLTSFEPFDGQSVNSSLEVGRAVAERPPPGVDLAWLTLPVVAGVCVDRAWECVENWNPALVLALGQAAGTSVLHIEVQAVNLHDFDTPDNAGRQPRNEPIESDGPACYQTTLDVHRILAELRARNLPAALSSSAGKYVCNHLLYSLLHRAARNGRTHPTGFLHLPLLPEQIKAGEELPSLPLSQMSEGVCVAITASQI